MNELEKKAYIFGTMFSLSNKLQVIGDQFDANITIKQWLLLVGIATFKEPPTISEVANYVGYSRQNAKRMAAALQERGFVTITKDNNDARALRITRTPKCMEYFAGRGQRELEFLAEIFDGFDAELTDGLYQGLSRLEKNVEKMADKAIDS